MKSNTGTKNQRFALFLSLNIFVVWKQRSSKFEIVSIYRILKRIKKSKQSSVSDTAAWSSGMILVSGAGGRGFDSRSSPVVLDEVQSNELKDKMKEKWVPIENEFYQIFVYADVCL